MKMKIIFRKILLLLWINLVRGSVSGISYMDPLKTTSIRGKLPAGEDPCNPLYWYPRNIPEYCYFAKTVRPVSTQKPPAAQPSPPAAPVLVPMPAVPILNPPMPILPPVMPILPPAMPILPPPIPVLPPPMPILAPPPMPFAEPPPPPYILSNTYPYLYLKPISYFSSNSLPYYPSFQRPPTGFVPGMHSLVTKDGGINIMPFSDVYADIIEKHKNKMIRRKLHKILEKYNFDPYSKDYRSLQKYKKYLSDE